MPAMSGRKLGYVPSVPRFSRFSDQLCRQGQEERRMNKELRRKIIQGAICLVCVIVVWSY